MTASKRIVIAISLFLRSALGAKPQRRMIGNDLCSLMAWEIAARFRSLYDCFHRVMGAQLLISTINTLLTAGFVLWVGLPYPALIMAITFICA